MQRLSIAGLWTAHCALVQLRQEMDDTHLIPRRYLCKFQKDFEHVLTAEAASAMLQHAFRSMDLHRTRAGVGMGNLAGATLLFRLRFVREGVRHGYEMKNGHPIDLLLRPTRRAPLSA